MEKLLLRGLKFTPIPQYSNIPQIQCDIKMFARSLRLKEQFHGRSDDSDDSLLRNKSPFIPMLNRDKSLEECIRRLFRLSDSLEDERLPETPPNLPASELKALGELKALIKEKKLHIIESDKGGFICLFDPIYIRDIGFAMLNDANSFVATDENCEEDALSEIKNLIKSHKPPKYSHSILTPKEEDYLVNFESKIASFYLLPKVLKSVDVKEQMNNATTPIISLPPPSDLKFRYIIGGPNSVTSRLSQLLDLILRPLTHHIPGYLKDSYHVLRMIDSEWRPTIERGGDFTIYTWDIKEFYPSLNFDLVRRAIQFWLERHPSVTNARFNSSFIIGALKLIMTSSNCAFDGHFYQFKKGLPTGTSAAVTLAVLVRGYLMETVYDNILRKHGLLTQLFVKKFLRAFIDDNISLWDNNIGDVSIVNDEFDRIQREEGIHFILVPPEHVNYNGTIGFRQLFLDLDIMITGNQIVVDMYDKSCHNFVPWQSCHPHTTKKNIPYSLALRIRTICDKEEDQSKRFSSLTSHLQRLGYPDSLVTDAINRAKSRDQKELRQDSPTNNESGNEGEKNVLPFVHTYNPKNPNIFSRIQDCLKILNESYKMKLIMDNSILVPSRRQSPNLKLLLTNSYFSMEQTEHQVSKCNDTRHNCQCCNNIVEGSCVEMEDGEVFTIQQTMNCKTENVVYVLFCNNCPKTYIGETGQKLCTRTAEHRCHILNERHRKLEVSHHVFECAGHLPVPFRIMPIYKMPLNCTRIERESKEVFFQKKFCPSLHPGPRISNE